ncbi:autotransporter assembly complex protein TamA [Zhongshania sp. BJYM1]|uniref:autotransporter assembly complex protein TamA n=1 Tax=Zhongshania aquatica TaxID=2965069 RepID=UPI0022B394CB|nr:autotransporter assembly complex family protein [Marortus sp. BJYM1]
MFKRAHPLIALLLFCICINTLADETPSLSISGGNAKLQENIRAHFVVTDISCQLSELKLRNRLRNSDDKISEALRALGYYHGKWTLTKSKKEITAQGNNNGIVSAVNPLNLIKKETTYECWQLHLALNPGPATKIAKLDVRIDGDGSEDPVFKDYLAKLPTKVGEKLLHSDYEDIKKQISQRARNAGYFDGKFTDHKLEVNTDTNTAAISIIFQSGARYHFGAINFGPSLLNDALLKRYLPFQSSDPFETDKLITLQNNLVSSNYFSSVNVDQENPDPSTNTVATNITFTHKKQYETTAGIGASTDTGPRISYGLNNRRINDDGDTYQITSQYSPVLSNLGYQYSQPGEKPLSDKTVWSTGVQRKDTDTSESTSYRAEVALISLTDNGWLQTLSLKFLRENFDIAGDSNSSTLLMPGIAYARSKANDRRYPTQGWRISAAARGALDGVVSNVSLAQVELDGKVILPLLGGRLISRGGLGLTALNDFSELPASLRFFAGGDNSVRGFAYESLGPENSDGEVEGGKHRLTGSIEYDHKVWGEFALATFYDAGNAFDTNDFTFYSSAGLGLRWFSPIGPIRVDFGFPLKDGGFRFHLSMGPDL